MQMHPTDRNTASSLDLARVARRPARVAVWKLVLVSLFLFLTGGPSVIAQYDESNPSVYWRLERARQQAFQAQRVRKKVIQRPTRLIRGARPRRGYTRAVPARPAPAPAAVSTPESMKAEPRPDPAVAGAQTAGAAPQGASQAGEDGAKAAAGPPAAPAPVMRIAVLGDNLGSQLARGLEENYRDTPQVEILRLTKDNSGLVRDDYHDWPKAVRELLADERRIDMAVMMVGSNDRQTIRAGGASHAPRSPEWEKIYAARIAEIVSAFKAKNIPLIWLGMPVMRIERLSVDMVAFNQIYRDMVQKNGGIFVDIWDAFIDDRSRFTLFGPDVNGEIVKLRLNDGVHFTKAGARKVAHFAEIDIKRLVDKRRAPAAAALASATPGAAPQDAARFGLPAPDAPAQIVIPVKPAAGPVIELTALPLAPDGELARARARARPVAVLPEAQPGRADDFRWPRQ